MTTTKLTPRRKLPQPRRLLVVLGALTVCTAALATAALFIGAADSTTQIITDIRAPRVILALSIGAGLGVSGALLQGAFRNPLADPGLVGVSAGAALGTVVIVAVGAAYGSWLAAMGGVIGGIAAMASVMWIAKTPGRTEVVTLILAGVAITAFAAAVLSIVVATSDSAGTRSTTFWTTGSFALATWPGVVATLPFIAVGLVIAGALSGKLDALSLGDRAAYASGVPVRAVRWWALIAAVLTVAAGVAVVGIIVFIGLLVPHAIRLVLGPRHGRLLAGSALGGALLILLADTAARTLAAPVELPVGVVTAIIGAPAFILLLRRTRREQGGWA
ncbi:MAG: iron ABC transporter permease [Candidatus Nanopelagicales bacterium]